MSISVISFKCKKSSILLDDLILAHLIVLQVERVFVFGVVANQIFVLPQHYIKLSEHVLLSQCNFKFGIKFEE